MLEKLWLIRLHQLRTARQDWLTQSWKMNCDVCLNWYLYEEFKSVLGFGKAKSSDA